MLGVTARGEWEEWLGYFLAGVAIQADDAVERIQRRDDLVLAWRRRLATSPSKLPDRVVELFAENPFWTIDGIAERLKVVFTSAQRAVDRMETEGMVTVTREAKRSRV